MSENNKKILPENTESDYSLPGRFEESNPINLNIEPIKSKPKNRGILIMMISFVIISSIFFSYYFLNQDEIDSRIIQKSLITDPEKKLVNQYGVGEYGSDHAHAAIAIFVNDEQINFGMSKFQLSSRYIHFENNNPYLMHKHATGAPLEMLFASLGMKITPECISLNYYGNSENEAGNFCTDQEQKLRFFVNGAEFHSDVSQYVFKHNDRILISYGDKKSISKQLTYLESLEIFDIPKKTPQYPGDGITI
ncbi:MAG: hypothetical protein OEM89_10010 [Nitrosopumilus sp.]|nr:hypothetical protein [Nitrosopumilus sp.]